jgi:hypothetical protein
MKLKKINSFFSLPFGLAIMVACERNEEKFWLHKTLKDSKNRSFKFQHSVTPTTQLLNKHSNATNQSFNLTSFILLKN